VESLEEHSLTLFLFQVAMTADDVCPFPLTDDDLNALAEVQNIFATFCNYIASLWKA
jgi:hypothetical protein